MSFLEQESLTHSSVSASMGPLYVRSWIDPTHSQGYSSGKIHSGHSHYVQHLKTEVAPIQIYRNVSLRSGYVSWFYRLDFHSGGLKYELSCTKINV